MDANLMTLNRVSLRHDARSDARSRPVGPCPSRPIDWRCAPFHVRSAVCLDPPATARKVGSRVHCGEFLGRYEGKDVCAPFDGIVGNIAFDPERAILCLTLLHRRVTFLLDAPAPAVAPGEHIRQGQPLGTLAGQPVASDKDGVVENVAFDPQLGTLRITLLEGCIMRRVNAAVFHKAVGERVHKGEVLGYFEGRRISAPFDAAIESIQFDPDIRGLRITLLQERTARSVDAGMAFRCGMRVAAGESLGTYEGRPVRAPFDAVVSAVRYEGGTQTLSVSLSEAPLSGE